MKKKRTYEETQARIKKYYVEVYRAKAKAKNVYHPGKLKTPYRPL